MEPDNYRDGPSMSCTGDIYSVKISRIGGVPHQAMATVNYRIHPRDSIEDLLQHARNMIDNDAIEVKRHDAWGEEPSPVSSSGNAAYARLATTF